ncbi:MAG TPA: hypothetical protein VEA69_22205 [Tepidisphaeraceae bacterium]|nr:hypothetical protein [Tepidisphaeraceae bacterium]
MNRTTTTTAARTIDRSEELLNRAQSVVDSLSRLLDNRSPAMARPVSTELMEDLLAVLPARSAQKTCCSL